MFEQCLIVEHDALKMPKQIKLKVFFLIRDGRLLRNTSDRDEVSENPLETEGLMDVQFPIARFLKLSSL